ncbi:MAG: organoarsenical effux MFS transporter ArsJ [Phycisphaerales bacterium]|nr:organoarsenical effux MFS transporter ArsJ [Phycisphaerales bacterium]
MNLRSYGLVTSAYWAFTVTDGALRMLVLLHFHNLGYSPLTLGFLFLLYEFFGVVTNLYGGWLATRFGLTRTLYCGLGLQIVALMALSAVRAEWVPALSVAWVMAAQALSGVAKDLTKMSSKSAIKLLVPEGEQSRLFAWVGLLTGSKNALKGAGFFLGGFLLQVTGFTHGLWLMAAGLTVVLAATAFNLRGNLQAPTRRVKWRSLLAKSSAVNRLSLARFFLFGARDIWFVVGLPLYLYANLEWSFEGVGAFMAAWVIGYGVVQAVAPRVIRGTTGQAVAWSGILAAVTILIALGSQVQANPEVLILSGLVVFGVVFAVNSSLHSYLILAYTKNTDVALDVGFYYSANAAGRLTGTLLSGAAYMYGGLSACLWASAVFLVLAAGITIALPRAAPQEPRP